MVVSRTLKKLPDGWGRSVVNGREIITAPSGYKEPVQNTSREFIKRAAVGAAQDAGDESVREYLMQNTEWRPPNKKINGIELDMNGSKNPDAVEVINADPIDINLDDGQDDYDWDSKLNQVISDIHRGK